MSFDDALKRAAGVPKGGICMLVIDAQNDFHPGGSLAVATANEDSKRIAEFMEKHESKISQVVLTLDSHQRYNIAHGIFWENAKGESPPPFTLITSKQVQDGEWLPKDRSLVEYAQHYAASLEASGKFKLCIWPEHCLIGSPGHNVVTPVHDAAVKWSKESRKPIQYVMKGNNSFTEHYSALKAEVELQYDPHTSLNQDLIAVLKHARKVIVCGEAKSHCVNYTMRDLVDNWPSDRIQDLILLEDCTSSVAGFEADGEKFVADMKAAGVTVTTTSDVQV